MAIDIVTIKNGCRSIQATAAQYDTVITQLESARSTCKADEIDIDGATMGQKFEEIEELVKQIKNATIEELTNIKGINTNLAEKIKKEL